MISDGQGSPSKAMIWTGWVLSALPSLLLFMSGGMKLVKPEMLKQMGFPKHWVSPSGSSKSAVPCSI